MNGYESVSVDLLMLLAGAVVIVLAVLAFKALVEIIPVTRARRETLRRGVPITATALSLVYCVVAVRVLLSSQPGFAALGTALVLLGFGVLAFGPMRDVVSGVVLKAGQVCQEGDQVRIDDLQGRILTMGLRVLVLETVSGDEAVIPYSRVARDRLLRSSGVEALSAHVFRVRAPAAMTLAATKTLIRQRAMLVHWSAVSRTPEVTALADGIEVTVYALDPDRGPDIEAEVRRALAVVDPPAGPATQLGRAASANVSAG